MKKVHRKLTEEENSSQCLKVLAQVTTEKTRMGAGILRQRQQTYFDKRLCYLKCSSFFFFTKTNEGKMEPTSRQTWCPVSKVLQCYIDELNLTVLLVLTE